MIPSHTIDTQAAICAEARSWLGTPYHHLADVKGVGVDCAMLVVRVFVAVGMVPADLDPRPYAWDWHLHQGAEKYRDWLDIYGDEVTNVEPGDIALWRFGRTYSHGAIVMEDCETIVHAYRDAGRVTLGGLTETMLAGRQRVVYRVRTNGG